MKTLSTTKCLAINSFSFQATVPPYNTGCLVGYLKDNQIDTNLLDINLITWNTLLSVDYLSSIDYNAEIINHLDCPFCPTLTQLEFETLKREVLSNIDLASQIIRSNDIYVFDKFCWAQKVYFDAMTLIYHQYGTFFTTHLPYWGNGVGFNYNDINSIYTISNDPIHNPLIRIFESIIIPQIKNLSPDIIFVEIMFPFDIIGALTLNTLIKKNFPEIHINYSGISFDEFNFSRVRESLKKDLRFLFNFDSIFLYRNDKGVLELIDKLTNHKELKIQNLLYAKSDKIFCNELNEYIPYDELTIPDYSDLNLDLYYVPERVFIDRLSTRCFWAKCSFCSINAHKGVKQLHNVAKTVEKIKAIQERYGVKTFWFLDEACPINHAILFAKELKRCNINIIWSLRTRISQEISKETLLELYQAGLRELWIGLEHIDYDILTKMNKAPDIVAYKKSASAILENSAEIGIGLHFCHIFGFPSETDQQREKVVDFYAKHKDALKRIPFFATFNTFGLAVDSPIYNNPEQYGISKIEIPDDNFVITNVPYETIWNDDTSKEKVIGSINVTTNKLMKCFTKKEELEYIWGVVADSPYELLFKANFTYNPFLND